MNDTDEDILLQWAHPIKMLFSARLWRTFVFVFGIPIVILGVIVMVAAGVKEGMIVVAGGFSFFAIVWAIVGAVVDISGGFSASYVVTKKGVYFSSGKGARAVAGTATLVGALAGSPGMAGAGLLARSEQDAFIAWNDIRKVSVDEGSRYIEIRAELGSKPIGLYCNEEAFQHMRDLLRTAAAK